MTLEGSTPATSPTPGAMPTESSTAAPAKNAPAAPATSPPVSTSTAADAASDAALEAAFLKKLGIDRASVKHDLASLTRLQRAHLTTIPFENLSIIAGDIPGVSVATSLSKIVPTRRGGWCFEVNAVFHWLLTRLGFRTRMLAAAVLLHGPNDVENHITTEVTLPEGLFIADAGFGPAFNAPLKLARYVDQEDTGGVFVFKDTVGVDGGLTLFKHGEKGEMLPQFKFTSRKRFIEEFAENARALGTNPDVFFTQKPFATRLLEGGPDRVWILPDKLKVMKDGKVTVTEVDEKDWDDVLEQWFGFRSPPSVK